jgi:hypothetical protein
MKVLIDPFVVIHVNIMSLKLQIMKIGPMFSMMQWSGIRSQFTQQKMENQSLPVSKTATYIIKNKIMKKIFKNFS